MAKSIFTTLTGTTFDVSHRGEDDTFDLPSWMVDLGKILDDEAALTKHLKQHDVLFAVIQSGIAQEIIKLRAVTRPTEKEDEKKSIKAEHKACQKSASAYKPKTMTRPDDPFNKAVKEMMKLGFTEDEAKELLIKKLKNR